MGALRRFVVGSREVDLDRAEVRGADVAVPLTPNEVKVLAVLSARAGEVVERDQLLADALGYRKVVNTRAIDQAVWRLRRKLEPEPHQPRWLLSEANVGYRLVLDPPAVRSLVGRVAETARVQDLLRAGPKVAVVGLPGSGRKTLVTAAAVGLGWPIRWDGARAVLGDDGGHTAWIGTSPPSDPAIPVVRLGALAPDEGRAVLVRAVLAARGSSGLSDDEDAETARVAELGGHHPATLVALARASVLGHLRDLREPPVVRAAVRLSGREPGTARFVDAVVAELGPLGVRGLDGLDLDVLDAIVARTARLDAALAFATPDQVVPLVPALVARVLATGRPVTPPTLPLDAPVDARCGVGLLEAWALERTDLRAALARATAAAALPASAPVAATAIRAAFRLHLYAEADPAALSPAVDALAALAAVDPRPIVVGSHRYARGLLAIRTGHTDAAREDLVAALGLVPRSALARMIASNLAAEAARDGRVHEALAWSDRVAAEALPP
ncbi:MAG: winged helix-turn-helix domain-containing protein, partial [Myxococcota bacterium]